MRNEIVGGQERKENRWRSRRKRRPRCECRSNSGELAKRAPRRTLNDTPDEDLPILLFERRSESRIRRLAIKHTLGERHAHIQVCVDPRIMVGQKLVGLLDRVEGKFGGNECERDARFVAT